MRAFPYVHRSAIMQRILLVQTKTAVPWTKVNLSKQLTSARYLQRSAKRSSSICSLFRHHLLVKTSLNKIPVPVMSQHQTSMADLQTPHVITSKGSWLRTLQTCRQIYLEAFPVFYGRKSYYTADAQEMVSFFRFGRSGSPGPLAFRGDGITSLCVKGLVQYSSDTTWAHCANYSPVYVDSMAISATSRLQGWKNLRRISLCMNFGEEKFYLIFLFRLPGLEHGVVEFLDESHWYVFPKSILSLTNHVESPDMSWHCLLVERVSRLVISN